jgi:PAS domain S-box-containing protein
MVWVGWRRTSMVDLDEANVLPEGRSAGWSADNPAVGVLCSLFEALPEATLVVDAAGVVVLASRRAVQMFGCAKQRLTGETIESLLPDLGGASLEGVVKGRRADGREFAVAVRAASAKTSLGALVILDLRPVEPFEPAEPVAAGEGDGGVARVRSEFVANMSHVLRTPLNSIIGFARLMHHGMVGPVSERHREYLGDILNSANHLLGLINDVLDLSKADAGGMQFCPQAIDLPQLLGEVREIVAAMAATKQVRIDVTVDPGCADLRLDPAKLKQVAYNFLSNALKFTDAGRIQVRATAEADNRWRLEVEDTGRGMTPAEVGSVFSEVSGKQPGLALTRRIVEAQGGHVGVGSVLGRGSTFFAVFPRATTPPPLRDATLGRS